MLPYVLVSIVSFFAGAFLWNQVVPNLKKLASTIPDQIPTHGILEESPAKPAEAFPSDRQWTSLMGNVLEYGDTGWQIVFKPCDGFDYTLFSPEGRVMGKYAEGGLPYLKQIAEQMQAQRQEFSAPIQQQISK